MSGSPGGHLHAGASPVDAVLVLLAGIGALAYVAAAVRSRRRGRPWPVSRAVLWCVGVATALGSVVGPLAAAAHGSFVAHMATHLLVGMLAPLLLVRAAPVTLALRSLSLVPARRLSRLLRSIPARIATNPIVAVALSAGGLWVIYLTPIYSLATENPLVHLALHAHLLVMGYLGTAAFVGIDPAPHRPPRIGLGTLLLVATASHAILSKYLYVEPPPSVPVADARAGAELMYYAGGWIEAGVILLFCASWYRASGRSVRPGVPGRRLPATTP